MSRNTLHASVSNAIYERDNFTCVYCGDQAKHIDHVIPCSKGGENTEDNLVASCQRCNTIVSDRVFSSFDEKKAWILKWLFTEKNLSHDTPSRFVQPMYKNSGISPKDRVKAAGITLRKPDFKKPGENYLTPFQEHLTELRRLDFTWREISSLPEYRDISLPSLCRVYKREDPGNKVRKQLGLPISVGVIAIDGVEIPEGTQAIHADQCPCGAWFLSNHPRRKKCFVCSEFKGRKDKDV